MIDKETLRQRIATNFAMNGGVNNRNPEAASKIPPAYYDPRRLVVPNNIVTWIHFDKRGRATMQYWFIVKKVIGNESAQGILISREPINYATIRIVYRTGMPAKYDQKSCTFIDKDFNLIIALFNNPIYSRWR